MPTLLTPPIYGDTPANLGNGEIPAPLTSTDIFAAVERAGLVYYVSFSQFEALFATAAQGTLAENAIPSTAIGVTVQPYDADLDAWATVNPSAYLNAAGIAAAYQPLDGDLTAIAGLTPAKGTILVYNGANWISLGVGIDTYVLVADSAEPSGVKWALASGASLDIDTRENILATVSPVAGSQWLTSDTAEYIIYDGIDFRVAPLELYTISGIPDIGARWPLVESDKSGYSDTWINNKNLSNIRVRGYNATVDEGALRTADGVFDVYLDGAWQAIVSGFRFREIAAGNYQLEHKPLGFSRWIAVHTGNSVDLDINGRPVVQGYKTDIGAFQTPTVIQGGSI